MTEHVRQSFYRLACRFFFLLLLTRKSLRNTNEQVYDSKSIFMHQLTCSYL